MDTNNRTSKSRSQRLIRSDREIVNAYKKTKSVHAAGKTLGIYGQTVHVRLKKLGVQLRNPEWKDNEDEILRREYQVHRNEGKLAALAEKMGRTKQFICRKARALGLTDRKVAKPWLAVWKGMSEDEARKHFERFKKSGFGLGQWCKRMGFDDLGFSRTMQDHFPDEWDLVIEAKSPKTKYRLGRQVEYRVRNELRKLGYFALRSPRSLGPIDLVAIKKGCVLFVQCKRSMSLPPLEWNALFEVAVSVGAIPVLAGSPTGRGTVYKRMLGLKDGSKRKQPMEDFAP